MAAVCGERRNVNTLGYTFNNVPIAGLQKTLPLSYSLMSPSFKSSNSIQDCSGGHLDKIKITAWP